MSVIEMKTLFSKTLLTITGSLLLSISMLSYAEPLKVAFVFLGSEQDAGWNESHEQGRQYAQQELGDKVITQVVSITTDRQQARLALEDVAKNNDLVFSTYSSFIFASSTLAKDFPEVLFEQTSGTRQTANLDSYNNRIYEARYLSGQVAGHMTKTGKIGYVAAHAIPEVIRGINAFTLGVRSVNPEATVAVEWLKGWNDPSNAAKIAQALIDNGADILTHHTNSSAVVETAEANKVYAIAYHADMTEFAPNYHLTAVSHKWGPYYLQRINDVMAGQWQPLGQWLGMKEGLVGLSAFSDKVPAEVQQQVLATEDAIMSGALQVFAGPIITNKGRKPVREGKVLSDAKLLRLAWYVDGVTGDLTAY